MYLKRTRFFAFLLLLTISIAVQADEVDDYVKRQMERQHVPGVAVVVIKDSKVGQSFLVITVEGREVWRAKKIK